MISRSENSHALFKANCFGLMHGWDATELADNGLGNGTVNLYDRNGFARAAGLRFFAAATQREVGNVDAVLAKNGPNFADHAGDVLVAHVNQVLLEGSFDIDAVDVKQTRRVLP